MPMPGLPVQSGLSRIPQALAFAAELHATQTRKVAPGEDATLAIPYLTHLLDVMSLTIQARGDEDQMIAALLHDGLEDQPVYLGTPTAQIIEREFGPRVLAFVQAATDGDSDMPRTPETWRPRKEEHIGHLKALAEKDPDVLLVPLADKLANGLAIVNDLSLHGNKVWYRFNVNPDNVCWYYGSMLNLFTKAPTLGEKHVLVHRLKHVVETMNHNRSELPEDFWANKPAKK